MRAIVVAAVVWGLTAVAAAPAGAAWSAPLALSQPHDQVVLGAAGHTTTGRLMTSWNWFDPGERSSTTGFAMASGRPTGSVFGAERALPADLVAGPRPYAAGRVVIATQSDRFDRVRGGSALRVGFGDLRGRFGSPRLVVRRAHAIDRQQLEVNARGDAVLAWAERVAGPDRIYASLRPRGGAFGPAVLLDRGAIRDISVAVGPAGDVLVAWDARGRVRSRFKGRAHRGFRPVDELRSQTTFHAALQTAVTASGRAWVAWTSQLLTEGGGIGDAYIQLARRPAGARRFDRALLLDKGGAEGAAFPSPVSLAAGPRGAAALAWVMTRRAAAAAGALMASTVMAAHVSVAGVPTIRQLARFDAVEPGERAVAAYSGAGEALVAWAQRDSAQSSAARALVAQRPPGADWGAPQLAFGGPVSDLQATYAPGGGPAVLLFVHRRGRGDATVLRVAAT